MLRSESADASWVLDLYPLYGVLAQTSVCPVNECFEPVHCVALMDCSSRMIVNSSASCTVFDPDSAELQYEMAHFICTTLEDRRMPGSVLLPQKLASTAGAFSMLSLNWFPPEKLVCCRGENYPFFAGISQWHSYLNAWRQRYKYGPSRSLGEINSSLDRLVRFRNRRRLAAMRRQESGRM